MKKALIAMSGGVDSSVAALLTQQKGYVCTGCTMKLYANEDIGVCRSRTCCSLDDVEDARSVAVKLGMPYYVFNFTDDFRQKIMEKFVDSYEHGITPNPCIDCNRYMKFDKLYERAKILKHDVIVTGHYARIDSVNGKYRLKKGLDDTKDQSYVLYAMTQEQLAHTLFPLGNMRKSEIRALAEENGFVNAQKPDSQDICFVPDGDYAGFMKRYRGTTYEPGDFVDINGHKVGTHRGIIHYTIGQRKGLGLAMPKPVYVCKIDTEQNTVTVGEEQDLFKKELIADDFHWISEEIPQEPLRCNVKIRYRQKEEPATVQVLDEKSVRIVFDTPKRAITKGQAAVLYDGDVVLGGGVIADVVG